MSRRARGPRIVISDESDGLLDSGRRHRQGAAGARQRARSTSSTPTPSGSTAASSNLDRLALAWDAARMDILIMLADLESATGHYRRHRLPASAPTAASRARSGAPARADLCRRGDRRIRASSPDAPAGAALAQPSISTAPSRPAGCSACAMDGHWITVGTPDAIPLAEAAVAARLAERPMSGPSAPARLFDPGRRAVPADARRGRCSSGALVPGFAWDRRSARARRRHHLRADAARRARVAQRLCRARWAAARRSCRSSGRSASSTRRRRAFDAERGASSTLAPPIAPLERLLRLAPLVRAWKRQLPAHVAAMFEEEMVVPASAADAIWLARDLAGADRRDRDRRRRLGQARPSSCAGRPRRLVAGDARFPRDRHLALAGNPRRARPLQPGRASQCADPAPKRSGCGRSPPAGPVIAAGSTGSIPATAELLGAIAGLPNGAVVLPGLDRTLDERHGRCCWPRRPSRRCSAIRNSAWPS